MNMISRRYGPFHLLAAIALLFCATNSYSQYSSDTGLYEPEHPEVMNPAIQILGLIEGMDYFPGFLWGDETFVNYILLLHFLDTGGYSSGDGMSWNIRLYGAEYRFDRAMLAKDENGDVWWALRMSGITLEIDLEYRIAAPGVPLEIRYRNPETGFVHSRVPMIADGFDEVRSNLTEDEVRKGIYQRISSLIERLAVIPESMSSPEGTEELRTEELKTEELRTEAGVFRTTRYKASIQGGAATSWYDFSTPGYLIAMDITPEGEEAVIEIECVELTSEHESSFDGEFIISDSSVMFFDDSFEDEEYGVGVSEGSPTDPVTIIAGEWYDGSVSEAGTSYFEIFVPKRSDLSVVIRGASGGVEAMYYAEDASFGDWVTASSGGEPSLEDYYVAGNSYVYFTVADIPDDGEGQWFTIDTVADYVLDPIGVSMRDDIYKKAGTLVPGTTEVLKLGKDGLHYFSVVMPKDGVLRVVAYGLPPNFGLEWYDTDGSYDSAYWSAQDDIQFIEVTGLRTGAVCYFYLAGEPDSEFAEEHVEIEVVVE